MSSPAFTCALSAVFWMWIIGAATQISSDELSEPSLLVVTVPVLSTRPPVSSQGPPVVLSVVDVMCTVNAGSSLAVPAGTVTGPQSSSPLLIWHVEFQPEPWSAICQFRPGFVGSGSDSVVLYASP